MSADEKRRLLAAIQLLLESGELTPLGARELQRIMGVEL